MNHTNTEEIKEWYYIEKGEVNGPFTKEEMMELYHQRRLKADTELWKTGMSDWTLLEQSDLLLKEEALEDKPVIKAEGNPAMGFILAILPVLFIGAVYIKSLPLFLVLALINCAISMIDASTLVMEGKSKKTIFLWALFLLPVYLFLRAKLRKEKKTYAFIWVALFLIEAITFTIKYDVPSLFYTKGSVAAVEEGSSAVPEGEASTIEGNGITIDKIIQEYISNPQYDLKETQEGYSLFTVTGKMEFEAKEALVSLNFKVMEDGTVHFLEMVRDGETVDPELYFSMVSELKAKNNTN